MVSYDPLDSSVTSHPYPHYAALRDMARVAWIESLEGYAISKWDDVLDVLSNGKVFSSAQFWPVLLGEYDPVPEVQPMISLDPPHHIRIRKLANAAFVPGRIKHLDSQIRDIANELIDDIISKHGTSGEFDFVWEFSALFPVTVVADILGVDLEKRVSFKHWVDDLLSAGNRAAYGPERLAVIQKSSEDIRAYFEKLYEDRLASPKDDMISGFIKAEADGQKLSKEEVLNLAILLLIGGVETTTNLLGITFAHMRSMPEVLDEVRADYSKIPSMIEEMLRFDGPVQMLFRHTTKEVELAGTKIPKGALVLPLLGSANHDEEMFEDSESFKLDRNPKKIMSFGQGPHFCLGSYLSRMEAKLALEVLLDRFTVLESVSDDVEWMDSYFARGPKSLPVKFETS